MTDNPKHGLLPEGWEWLELEEVLSLNQSGTWGAEANGKEGYSILRSSNIHNSQLVLEDVAYRKIDSGLVEKYQLKTNDILVTKSSGSEHLVGKNCMFIQPEDGKRYLFSNFTQRLRVDESKMLPRFLFFFLNSNFGKANLERIQSTTSGLRNLNMQLYNGQPIITPPLPTQHKIVEILERADVVRRKRQEADKKTAQILQAAFVKMFGDPVINPNGITVATIRELVHLVTKGESIQWQGEKYVQSGIPFIRTVNVQPHGLDFTNGLVYVTEQTHNRMKRSQLMSDDVLITIAGTLGRACVIEKETVPANINQDVAIIRLKKDLVLPKYIEWAIKSQLVQTQIEAIKQGSGRLHLNLQQVKSLKVPLPPLESQQKFVNLVERLDFLNNSQAASKTQINEIFQGLMQKAFKGDLIA